jgi:serine/threonine-protein kinase
MTRERWERVNDLFHRALERGPGERAAFLAKACADDEVRREVESLLAYDDESTMEQYAGDVAAAWLAESRPGGADAAGAAGAESEHGGRALEEGAIFGGRYDIEALLGRGGMGEVYLARDARLGRRVAIKLLAGEAPGGAGYRRFEREARAIARIAHPNVCTIHEVGRTEDGRHFIAMEYVEGETLRQRLARGPLGVREALDVGWQVAKALAAAHQAGVVHRDVKPENIVLRKDGYVKVLDFGLAKLTAPADARASRPPEAPPLSLTDSGVVMGTVSYMSPEQARGLDVDARTDVWSLGVVLYEALAGRPPFAGETATDVLVALVEKEPAPLASPAGEPVPAGLARLIARALRKNRAERYQTSAELLDGLGRLRRDLDAGARLERSADADTDGAMAAPTGEQTTARWTTRLPGVVAARRARVAAALVAALALGAAAYMWGSRPPPVAGPPGIRSIAVLPLENLSGDPAQEYFADGMTEALISNLAQVRALRVISRTSVMRFKGSRAPLPEIARELDVDAVIEGSVQRSGGRVRIRARLIDVARDASLRSFDYERELADALKLQSDVARAVADEIHIQLTAEERGRLAAARGVDPAAHEAYLLGRYHRQRLNEGDLALAVGHLDRAVQLDANYAAAWAELSAAWRDRGIFGAKSFPEVQRPVRDAAVRAIELDAASAEAHAALAQARLVYDLDWAAAEQGFRRAIVLDPSYVEARTGLAFLQSALCRHAEAIVEIQIAERLDPLSPSVQSAFGRILYRAGQYAEAERRLLRAGELEPKPDSTHSRLVDVYLETGAFEKALAILEERLAPGDAAESARGRLYDTAKAARAYAGLGRTDEARRILGELQRTTDWADVPKLAAAAAWAALGDKDEAFRLLFGAAELRNELLVFVKAEPAFEGLRSDPRWEELLRRMNFPEE